MDIRIALSIGLFLFLILGRQPLWADIADPDRPRSNEYDHPHIELRVSLVNAAQFPEYAFFLVNLEEDWFGEFEELALLDGQEVSLGNARQAWNLVARKNEQDIVAATFVGEIDEEKGNEDFFSHRLQKLKILEITASDIQFEIVSDDLILPDGKTYRPDSSLKGSLGWLPTLLLPISCLLGLFLFWSFRKKFAAP